ncbi:MAG: ATP-binding cassette domain-containing protein, partial [Eubacterium sp.]|nr:ATP-binding cassette domain-containing protein [Eubacterium sp.]
SDIVRLIITGLLGVLIGLLMPILNEYAYDSFIPGGDKDGLLQIGVLLLSCSLGAISFTVVKNIATLRSLNAVKYALQSAVFDRLFHLPESFYRDYDAAELGIKSTEISNICLVAGSGTIAAVISFVFSFLYLFQMFRYGGSMALVAIVILAIVVIFVIVMGVWQLRYEKKKLTEDIEAQSMMYQTIRGVSKLRMAGAEERSLQRYVEKLVSSQKINEKSETITNITMALMSGSSILFSIIFYTMMVNDDMGLTVGEFAAFTSAFGAFSMAVFTLAENFLTVNMVKPMYENMKPILQTLPESTGNAAMPGDLQGEIEIIGVTFGYDKEQEPVLKDFSLHVRPGEYIGVVGPSGCGKSTLLKLLLGFEKPQRGKIYYDNLDIDSLDKAELRKKFGVVLQDGGLIPGSIYENISITATDVTRERVDEVVDEVGLGEDIAQMPMGLHTVVSEESGTISGGQKQRILIARAIIGKPKLIFLDEATSALDNTTQAQIVETLDKLDATKIVIAHRLSTVIGCDRIIVMDEGRIKEEGTYDELMKRKGMFYELASRQLS